MSIPDNDTGQYPLSGGNDSGRKLISIDWDAARSLAVIHSKELVL